jgi:hypothetical protein
MKRSAGGEGVQASPKKPTLATPSKGVTMLNPAVKTEALAPTVLMLGDITAEHCEQYLQRLNTEKGRLFVEDVTFKTLEAMGNDFFHTTSNILLFSDGPLQHLFPVIAPNTLQGVKNAFAKRMLRWGKRCDSQPRVLGAPYIAYRVGSLHSESQFRVMYQTEEDQNFSVACTPRPPQELPSVSGLMTYIDTDMKKRGFLEGNASDIYPDDDESTFALFAHVGPPASGKSTQMGHIDKITADLGLRNRVVVDYHTKPHQAFGSVEMASKNFVPSMSHTVEEAAALPGLANSVLNGTDNNFQRVVASAHDDLVYNAKWQSHGWGALGGFLSRWNSNNVDTDASAANRKLVTISIEEPFLTEKYKKTSIEPARHDTYTGELLPEVQKTEDCSYGMSKAGLVSWLTQGTGRSGLGGLYLTLHNLNEIWLDVDSARRTLDDICVRLVLVSLDNNEPDLQALVGQPLLDVMEKCRSGSVKRLQWYIRDFGHTRAMLWIRIPDTGKLIPEDDTPWSNFALFTKDSCSEYLADYASYLASAEPLSLAKLYHSKCCGKVGIFKPSEESE